MEQLIDNHQRPIHYLRLSVTDRCNMRCTYCMEEEMQFMPQSERLSFDDFITISRVFVNLGVKKIRLTGGEPLIYSRIVDLCQNLSQLPNLQQLTMTSNGALLTKYAKPLYDAGLQSVNISIDSLDKKQFKSITRTGNLDSVLEGIDCALSAGLKIKLNTVLLPHYNIDQLEQLVSYALPKNISIRFIEEMPLGNMRSHIRVPNFSVAQQLQQQLHRRFNLQPIASDKNSGPARLYQPQGYEGHIGFISAMSHNFCDDCNRVRLSCSGQLIQCLGHNEGIDLRPIVQNHPNPSVKLQKTIIQALQHKPKRHDFGGDLQVLRFMNATGG